MITPLRILKYQNKIIKKYCIECGKEFYQRRILKGICSDKCKERRRKRARPRTKLKCQFCGKDFYPKGGYLKQKFCSKKCGYLGRKVGGKKGKHYPHLQRARIGKCEICGKDFRAVKDFKNRKQKYCSKECWNKRNPPTKKNCELCRKEFESYQRKRKYCSFECRNKAMVGRKLDDKTKKKMSKAKKGKLPKNHWQKGELHPFWKKDRSLINALDTKEYNELRLEVFKRDNYTCGICERRGKKGMRIRLELHHIKSKRDYPELFWEIDNCMTICKDCHKKTDSYLNRWK